MPGTPILDHEREMGRRIAAGEAILVEDGVVYVKHRDFWIDAIETRCDRGVVDAPIVLDFRS